MAKRIVVIGGGISGLACAHRLLELKNQNGLDFEILLIEGAPRLGGTIETVREDGFLLEKGADSFVSEKPYALELAKRLGIDSKIIPTQDQNRKSFVVKDRRLVELPEGFYLIAPTGLRAFFKSPLFSPLGKLRMMMEPFVRPAKGEEDESVGSFIRRRLGEECFRQVGQPMMAGIYAGDPDTLSLKATMPRFKDLEQKYGSVIGGLLRAKKGKSAVKAASGPRYSLFLSFEEGMETLTRELTKRLGQVSVKLNSRVTHLERQSADGGWRIVTASGENWTADAVCLTHSALQASQVLWNAAPALSEKLGRIAYESVVTVNLAYRGQDIAHPLNGFGFVVPAAENMSLIACTFCNQKFAKRAPEGYVLLRAFAGGVFGKQYFAMDDHDLTWAVRKDLKDLLGVQAEPVLARVSRYKDCMTQYRVGHQGLVEQIKQELMRFPGLHLSGSAYEGMGIPDCIRDAERQAEAMVASLHKAESKIENPVFLP